MHIAVVLVTNYLALVTTIWLGIYIVSRSPRNLLSWLTGLTLWSIGGLFLNTILALNPLPPPTSSPEWLRIFFLFWPEDTLESGWVGWLQGWQVVPAIIFWHHATIILRPGAMNWWRLVRVVIGYAVAIFAIFVLLKRPLVFADVYDDPLFLHTLIPGPLYFPFLLALLLFTFFCLVNILRSIRFTHAEMPRRQLVTMAVATVIAGLTVPSALMAAVFEFPVPRLSYTLLLLVSVTLIGYGVARYSALMEGRTIRHDFVYSAVTTGFVIAVYSLVTWVSVSVFSVPPASFVFIIILAIVTHSLIDATRHTLDTIIFRRENREIRANLRKLAYQVGEEDLGENVSLALNTLCNSVRATYGLVLIFDASQHQILASYNFQSKHLPQSIDDFLEDDVIHLQPDQFPPPLEEAALLVPLYIDTTQIGALVLGRPTNSTNYSKEDIDLLLYPSDRLSEIIYTSQRETEYIQQLSQFSDQKERQDQIPTKEVENALRNIFDYAALGDSILANLKLIDVRLSDTDITHVDRGKAVNHVLTEAVDKLRPDTVIPRNPPPREWHPYLILHGAYIEDKLNRDIMAQLYVSEGTFNRTRRAAIRSVARVLEEMETVYH